MTWQLQVCEHGFGMILLVYMKDLIQELEQQDQAARQTVRQECRATNIPCDCCRGAHALRGLAATSCTGLERLNKGIPPKVAKTPYRVRGGVSFPL